MSYLNGIMDSPFDSSPIVKIGTTTIGNAIDLEAMTDVGAWDMPLELMDHSTTSGASSRVGTDPLQAVDILCSELHAERNFLEKELEVLFKRRISSTNDLRSVKRALQELTVQREELEDTIYEIESQEREVRDKFETLDAKVRKIGEETSKFEANVRNIKGQTTVDALSYLSDGAHPSRTTTLSVRGASANHRTKAVERRHAAEDSLSVRNDATDDTTVELVLSPRPLTQGETLLAPLTIPTIPTSRSVGDRLDHVPPASEYDHVLSAHHSFEEFSFGSSVRRRTEPTDAGTRSASSSPFKPAAGATGSVSAATVTKSAVTTTKVTDATATTPQSMTSPYQFSVSSSAPASAKASSRGRERLPPRLLEFAESDTKQEPELSLVKTLCGHKQPITALTFSSADGVLASASKDGILCMWDLSTHTVTRSLLGHTGKITDVQVDDTGACLVSSSADATLKIWDLDQGECVNTLRSHTASVNCLQFDESTLASGGSDNTVKMWDIESGYCMSTFVGHTGSVNTLQFFDYALASGSSDENVKMWDTRTGKCHRTLSGHTGQVRCLQFSAMTMISGSSDGFIKVWDLRSARCVHDLHCSQEVHTLQFDDSKMLVGTNSRSVKIFDARTFDTLGELETECGPVVSLEFIDGLAIVGSQTSLCVWRIDER